MLNRSKMLQEIDNLLTSEGYKTSNIYDHVSFDLVARKNLLILLLKTFLNIDSINEANAHEMKQLANIFLASPIIIGEKSRNGILEEGVIYERYDIPAISFETLKNMILYKEYPEILADRGVHLYIHPSHNVPGDTTAHERLDACLAEYKKRVAGV